VKLKKYYLNSPLKKAISTNFRVDDKLLKSLKMVSSRLVTICGTDMPIT
jgi:hypothetical protein